MTSKEMREVLSCFMEHCPDCFTMHSVAITVLMSVCSIAFQFYRIGVQSGVNDIVTEKEH